MSLMKNIVLPEERSLAFYLAMEEYVAKHIEEKALFVWRVQPTVIVGRNQVLENEVNLEYCRHHHVKIVRRKSGGGCVYADKGNIMISYISGRGEVPSVFENYLDAVVDCLGGLGLKAKKSGRNDILIGGRKVSGNAFHQLPDRSIVHGTLLYDTDLEALTEAIKPPLEKLQRHGVESVRQRVQNLKPFLNPECGIEEVEQHIIHYFCDGRISLTEENIKEIEKMESQYECYN